MNFSSLIGIILGISVMYAALSATSKDIMMFVALHGWVCNPQGSEDDFEGSRCYDVKFNDRDAASQVTIMDE